MIYSPEKSVILTDKIGDDVKIHAPVWIGKEVIIGDRVKIQGMAYIPDGVILEDDVFIGPSVCFTNDKMPPSHGKFWSKTLVKKGASIGANSTILPGITIGENSILGAGSVATKDIPDNQIWAGNPARFIRKRWNWCVMGDKGFIAPRHIRAIEEIGDRVAMTCDIEKDWKEVIKTEEWEKIDAVALCTPNYLHYPMAEAMKDKVVLSEKPLCLSSKEVEKLKDTNVVLQLRHHPEVIKWKSLIENNSCDDCKLTVKMFRDEQYWNSWKGDNAKSGGILFNLGIHYFDLLIHLFGEKYEIKERIYTDKRCYGVIMFGNTKVSYEIEIIPTREGQVRKLEIDGQEVVLSTQDNLSYEGLHTQIYKDVRKGKGIKPEEAIKSIKLVEELCENNAKNA